MVPTFSVTVLKGDVIFLCPEVTVTVLVGLAHLALALFHLARRHLLFLKLSLAFGG
jgi:hypothetical protein